MTFLLKRGLKERTRIMLSGMILRIFATFITILPVLGQKYYLEHNGKNRNYIIHLPLGYNAEKTYPLVLNFHGGGGDPEQQQEYTQMDKVADKVGFIVVYPDSYRFWNVRLFPWDKTSGTDDVGFVRIILDSLEAKFSVDKDSIYAVGLSFGGFLTNRLACELSDRIAAFASISGPMTQSTRSHCLESGKIKIPFLYIHGTLDPLVRYIGSKDFLGAERTVKFWKEFNNCQTSDTLLLNDNCPDDKTRSEMIRYKCEGNVLVWFVKIKRGGHTWPGGKKDYWYFGNTSFDFNASRFTWDFFRQFSLKRNQSM